MRARELTLEQRREIERVSRSWLRGQPERGFSMALDDMHAPDHGDAVFALGYDADRRLVGFVHFVPAPASGDLSLSAMRRLHHTPNGLMEFLLCETFQWAGGRGIERISLNFNAFGDLLRSDAKLPAWERGLRFVLARADRFFQVERLLDFNRKFFPEWEPRYAAFERYSDLPLAALVLLSIESLVAWPRRAAAALAARLAGAACAAGRRPRDLRRSRRRLRPTAVVPFGPMADFASTSPPAPLPASREQLASVLDARLTEIWAELFQVPRERWDHELIGWFLRAAYGQGYCDALREPAGGSLTRELGYEAAVAPRQGAVAAAPPGMLQPPMRGSNVRLIVALIVASTLGAALIYSTVLGGTVDVVQVQQMLADKAEPR